MRRIVLYGLSLAGAIGGAVYAFNFGRQISGWMLGALLGLNAFIFFGMVVGMALERLWPPKAAQEAPARID